VSFCQKSIRFKNYDYSKSGAYFVTICTIDHIWVFGEVSSGFMYLNNYGKIARRCWQEIPKHFQNVMIDLYIIMPNHIHGIIWLCDQVVDVTERHASLLHLQKSNGQQIIKKPKLHTVIGSFKSAVSRQINLLDGHSSRSFWQKSFYEHIVRDDISLNKIRKYIQLILRIGIEINTI
jgi:putative transposase